MADDRQLKAHESGGPDHKIGSKPKRYAAGIRGIAIAQIVLAGFLFLLDIIGLSMLMHSEDFMTLIGVNFWTGALFAATGITGIVATRISSIPEKPEMSQTNSTKWKWLTAFLIMSVICCVVVFGMIGLSVPAMFMNNHCGCLKYDPESRICLLQVNCDALKGLRITSFIIYVILLLISIAGSAVGCSGFCRNESPVVQVIYLAHPPDGTNLPSGRNFSVSSPSADFMPAHAMYSSVETLNSSPSSLIYGKTKDKAPLLPTDKNGRLSRPDPTVYAFSNSGLSR